MLRRVPFLVVPCLLAACAGGRMPATETTTTPSSVRIEGPAGTVALNTTNTATVEAVVVDLPAERLWQVMPAVYAELGVPVKTLVAEERLIGNPVVRFRRRLGGLRASDLFSCGYRLGEPNADSYQIEMSLHTRLRADGATRTGIMTEATASATPVTVAGNPVACGSTGRLERHIVELARKKAGG